MTAQTSTSAAPTPGFVPGLEGVVAFETEIAEPDRDGGALRYRGVDIEELAGRVTYGQVWGLLVDGEFGHELPPAEHFALPVRSGDVRVDVQAALPLLAPAWGLQPVLDIDDAQVRADLARVTPEALSFIAQSGRDPELAPVSQEAASVGRTTAERVLIRIFGEADPQAARALDAYFVSAAEHGMNASTFTARVIASTGADVAAAISGAVGALSGPLHGGAPSRVLGMLDEVERTGDAHGYVKNALDRKERLMGFGHRVYRAEDPRARALRRVAGELGAARLEAATALETEALEQLSERYPDRVLSTNVEFWAAIILDFAQIPSSLFTPMFTAARLAGWSAHILEQKRTGRLVRPSARYVGPGARAAADVPGWSPELLAYQS